MCESRTSEFGIHFSGGLVQAEGASPRHVSAVPVSPLVPPALAALNGAAECTQAARGSRRKRLWEVPRSGHCPIIGVCLPIDGLRRVVDKVLGGETLASDYDLHVGAVTECGQRNRLSEALHRELERRCAPAVRRFAAAKSAEALVALWQQAVEAGDVAGPLWAALSHPRCDEVLHEQLCRDIHMVQHQAGATVRADVRELGQLRKASQELGLQLASARVRVSQLQAERVAALDRLGAELMAARANLIGRDTLIETLRAELAGLREAMPELQSRQQLSQRVSDLSSRNRALEAELADLRRQLSASERERETAERRVPPRPIEAAQASSSPTSLRAGHLAERSVLCVGGRHAQIPVYRDIVERHGGRFSHHDGGIEDNPHRLDASLAAADLVICQTGCLSHNAYWLVKEHCKRTGKRCVYLEQPSAAGLARSLAALPVDDLSVEEGSN